MGPGNITRSEVKGFYNHYLDQSIDSATFLWLQRDNAVKQPHYCYEDIVALDHRLDALIRVLACSPDDSWQICEKALELPQPGDVFVAAVLAYRSLEVRKIQIAVEAGLANKSYTRGLISAMAWLPGRLVHSWIKKFLTSKDLNHKYLALAVCCARREDPREHLVSILQREDCKSHKLLYLQAIKLAGILKRFDVLPLIRQALSADDGPTRFWALWTQVLLGDKSLATELASWITQPSKLQHVAINMALRVTPLIESRDWITGLSQNTQQLRQAIFAVTVLGDPQVIPWLIAQMQNPQCTRLAGEAFSTITGVNLEEQKLVLENIPDLDEILPDDIAEHEYFEISEDQNLPFPDVPKIAAIWQKYQQRFKPGTRYFMGKQADDSQEYLLHLRNIYAHGNQRQRSAAALELTLKEVGHYWLNPKAGANSDE